MKLYTFLTETHKIFLGRFIDTFPFEDNFDLEIKFLPQECLSGDFQSDGWNKTMNRKVDYIINALESTNENSFFIHSDVDIQFFGKIKYDLEKLMIESNKDILFQDDGNQACMGFFICKKNESTTNYFNVIKENLNKFKNDQFAANFYLNKIKHGLLPDRYFSIGPKYGLWNGEDKNFVLPKNILMHHANFTIGVDRKINLLDKIRKIYNG